MGDAPIRVETLCGQTCREHGYCLMPTTCDSRETVKPGSLTEAMMRLAEAYKAERDASAAVADARNAANVDYDDFWPPEVIAEFDRLTDSLSDAKEALAAALARVRERRGA